MEPYGTKVPWHHGTQAVNLGRGAMHGYGGQQAAVARALRINQRDGRFWEQSIHVYPMLQTYNTYRYMRLSETAPNTFSTQYTDFLVGFRRFNTSSRAYCCYYHLGYGIFFDRDCMNKLLAFSLEFGSALISKNPLVRKEQHQFPPPCRKDR